MRGLDRRAALEIVRTTLAADCACKPTDWTSGEVTIVEARELVGRMRFPFRAKPFSMTTMGRGVVIACGADRIAWANAQLRQRTQDELFSISTLGLIADFLAQDGQILAGPYLRYLCASDTFSAVPTPPGFALELFGRDQMADVYRFGGFHHALSYELDHPCPDVIAVAAWHNDHVIGMAGVSADSDPLWQIGVNVAPEFQGMGVGKALVSRATEATLEHDRTPYYATRINNILSGNTARSVGYQLAWTDVYVRDS